MYVPGAEGELLPTDLGLLRQRHRVPRIQLGRRSLQVAESSRAHRVPGHHHQGNNKQEKDRRRLY